MKNYILTITAIAFLAFASCNQNTELNTEQNTAIKKAVEDQYLKLISTLNHLDFNALSDNSAKMTLIQPLLVRSFYLHIVFGEILFPTGYHSGTSADQTC